MNAGELLEAFRSDQADNVEPFLWSDDDFFRYADDAQNQFCQLTDGISDASTAAAQLAIVAGTEWYDTHPSLMKIRTATRRDTGRKVAMVNPETMDANGVRFQGRSGPLSALVVGLEDDRVRAYPIPAESVVVELAVLRMPLVSITAETSVIEVPAHHHVHLLHWVKSRAYLKQDAETFDKSRSNEFETRFYAYCAQVKAQQSRARRVTGAVVYGGL